MRKYIITLLVGEEKVSHTVFAFTYYGAIQEAHKIYGVYDVVDCVDLAETNN